MFDDIKKSLSCENVDLHRKLTHLGSNPLGLDQGQSMN